MAPGTGAAGRSDVGAGREGDRLVGLGRRTAKFWGTWGAAFQSASPAWSAAIVQVPAATSVTVVPLTVQTGRCRRGVADRQAGAGAGAHGERRVAQGLVGQGVEGDRLVALADGEAAGHLGRGVVGRVAGLVGGDRAEAHAEERDAPPLVTEQMAAGAVL